MDNLRADPRSEEELYWRFNFADGDASGLSASPSEAIYEPIIQPEDLTCGPIFVAPSNCPVYAHLFYELDLETIKSIRLRKKIDAVLRVLLPEYRDVLWLVYGAPADGKLFPLYPHPDLKRPAACCNLIPFTDSARIFHKAARSRRDKLTWLRWLGDKAARGDRVPKDVLGGFRRDADVKLLKAITAYTKIRKLQRKTHESKANLHGAGNSKAHREEARRHRPAAAEDGLTPPARRLQH